MKQLNNFLSRLRDKGYSCQCNWQKEISSRSSLEYYTIINMGNNKSFMVIFQVYGEDKGFLTYTELPGNSLEKDFEFIEERLKKPSRK